MTLKLSLVVGAVSMVLAPRVHAQAVALDEGVRGVETVVRSVRVPAGYDVRTILTRPRNVTTPTPAILFVQWLSCDPVTMGPRGGDGWAQMMRGLIERSGMIVARTEKPGLGGNGGPRCDQLGYREELAAHRAALQALMATPGVAADSVFLFGGSMGGTMVALLAAETPVRGVIVWGSTGYSWREHLVRLDRRVMELRKVPPADRLRWMPAHERMHRAYLDGLQSPAALARRDTALASAWGRMIGTSPTDQYGRPFAFHQEAHAADWADAWRSVRAPVLVVHGEYDWIMARDEHQRIVDLVSSRGGHARLVTLPQLDHNFARAASQDSAFRQLVAPASQDVAETLVRWLESQRRSPDFEDVLLARPRGDGQVPPTFERLLGSWALSVTYAPGTAHAATYSGEWHFARILEGRAIQDVWRVVAPDSAAGTLRGYGTTVRLFDTTLGAWRSTWHGPLGGAVVRFIGRPVDGEIHLVPEDASPEEQFRWVFHEITAETFRWRAESSTDRGRTWVVQQQMHARRIHH